MDPCRPTPPQLPGDSPRNAPPALSPPPSSRPQKTLNVIRRNLPSQIRGVGNDLYHWLLTLSWIGFMGLIALSYVITNVAFALAYMVGGDQVQHIQNAQPGSFWDAFFFSVQTMATIGYGAMSPASFYANLLVTAEAFVGLLGVALATGLVFARFARPSARVLFSEVAVISHHDGVPTLHFRAANQRNNQIVEAQIGVTLARNELTREGEYMRRLHDLKLVRTTTPIFAASWTVMHPITPDSPLFGLNPEDLEKTNSQLIVILTGIDDIFADTVHDRHIYLSHQILWRRRFVDILQRGIHGERYVDYTYFHLTVPETLPMPLSSVGRER